MGIKINVSPTIDNFIISQEKQVGLFHEVNDLLHINDFNQNIIKEISLFLFDNNTPDICKNKKQLFQELILITQNYKYNGKLDEQTQKRIKEIKEELISLYIKNKTKTSDRVFEILEY